MRRFHRGLTAIIGLGIGVGLAGCGSMDPSSWFDNKKPLPGERHLVFPEGVPGVAQGVPKELVKGNQPATTDTASVIGVGSEPSPAPSVSVASSPAPTVSASAEAESGGQRLVGTPKPWTGKPSRSRSQVASRSKPGKPKEAKAPASAQPAEARAPASSGRPSRITVAPTKPANQANGASGTLPSARSSADAAIWGPAPAPASTNAAGGNAASNAASNAPWPAAKPQQTSNAPWPDAPPANQSSR